MGTVEENSVDDAVGIGIFCGDTRSARCSDNRVAGTRPDKASGDLMRMGYGIVAHYGSGAVVDENEVQPVQRGLAAFFDSSIVRERSKLQAR